MDLREGLIVADRFRLIRMIGRGGMGSVWQATHVALDQPCAVKFIEGELANLAEAHARFEREAKAAAQLRSPHVVQIIDHGVWQGQPYIAMELLEGDDLGKVLTRAGGKLAPAVLNTIIQQVCRGLTRAHQAGVVHRDLKPDNIFLVNDDDRQLVKILDFGVAKSASQAIEGSNTKTGAMLGTPYYMSPEQAQGIKSVDSRSDLWSLAVIVYQCITGRLPFESEALGDLLVKIIVQPVPVPSHVAPVPQGFDQWWAVAADRNRDARFATAKDFAIALSGALGLTAAEGGTAPQPFQVTALMEPGPGAAAPAPTAQALANTPPPFGGKTAVVMSPSVPPAPQATTGGLGGTGSPSTLSNLDSPHGVPKRGVPIPIVAGIAAVVLIGLGAAAFVVKSSSGSSTSVVPTASASAVAAPANSASVKVADPTPAQAPTPPPTPAADPSAAPTTIASAKAPPTASEPAATVAAPTPKLVAKPTTPTTPTPPTPPKGASTPATTGGTKKPTMGDDRKW